MSSGDIVLLVPVLSTVSFHDVVSNGFDAEPQAVSHAVIGTLFNPWLMTSNDVMYRKYRDNDDGPHEFQSSVP